MTNKPPIDPRLLRTPLARRFRLADAWWGLLTIVTTIAAYAAAMELALTIAAL